MVLDTQPGVWVPLGPPGQPRPAPTSNQARINAPGNSTVIPPSPSTAFRPTGIKINIQMKDGKAKSSSMTTTAPATPAAASTGHSGQAPLRVTARPAQAWQVPQAPQGQPTASQPPQQQEALLPLPLRRPVPVPQRPPPQLASLQHQVKGPVTPFRTGRPATQRPPVPPFVARAQADPLKHVLTPQQRQELQVSPDQHRLRQQQQGQLDELYRLYRLAQERVREENDLTRQTMLEECGAAKLRVRQEIQQACNGLTPENLHQQLRTRIHDIDQHRQGYERDLQQKLEVELDKLHEQLKEQHHVLERSHLEEKVELEKEQANEVWQWLTDWFDGHSDKTPLFRCFPVFDSARHDRRKLYDFVRMAQLELGWTMDWNMPDVA